MKRSRTRRTQFLTMLKTIGCFVRIRLELIVFLACELFFEQFIADQLLIYKKVFAHSMVVAGSRWSLGRLAIR